MRRVFNRGVGRSVKVLAVVVLAMQALVGTTNMGFALTWYPSGGDCHFGEGFNADQPCLQWTGGYPGGVVRAFGGQSPYAVMLQVCTFDFQHGCVDSDFHTIATDTAVVNYKKTTPAKTVAKYGHYRACFQDTKGGSLNCWVASDAKYLGD